ncbi:hypothetical protein JMG10_20450 [Nostoc ellipsosporum NOK]|nr:hypothetical protein [Nostoc ellipsosporum NOK]
MIKNILLLLWMLMTGQISRCQSQALPPAMLHTIPVPAVAGRPDIWSSLSQPAALARHRQWQVGVLGEQRFGMTALSDYLAGLILPAGSGSLSLQWRRQGGDLFNRQQMTIAYGMPLGRVMDIGAGIRYNHIRLRGYGSAGIADAMLGMLLRLSEKVTSTIYMSYVSPNASLALLMQSAYRLGMSYNISKEAAISGVMQVVSGLKPDLLAAIDYGINENIRLRCSFSALSAGWGLSMAWGRGVYRVDLFSSHHTRLGLSPGIAMVYQEKSNVAP